MELSRQYGVDMPLAQAVDQIVNHDLPASAILEKLMSRDMKNELL
jgi:glycerol-3-phosphate dehydrogenase